MPLQFTGRFTQAFLDNPADGTYTDGSGLYLAVRNNGKARSWSFRHRGKRKNIGSAFKISLQQAQAQVRSFRDLIADGVDLNARGEDASPPAAVKVWTFADEAGVFFKHKCQAEWGDDAKSLGKSMIKKYIQEGQHAATPFAEIDVGEVYSILQPSWSGEESTPVLARRAAYMIGQMVDLAQAADPPRYPPDKKNPVDLTKRGRLRKLLGKQPFGGHRLGLAPELTPKLVSHLYQPVLAHGPDECTAAEAAEAIGCDPQAIRHAWRRGKIKNRRKLDAPYDHRNAPWVYPIAELKKVFHFRREVRQHAEVGPHAYVLLFIIYTAVRSDMACSLLWSEVKWERGIIDFGKRHKMMDRDPEADYTIPLTPEVKRLLLLMKEIQKRNGTNTPYVFVHSPTRIGVSLYHGKPANDCTVNEYFKRCLMRLDLVNGETDQKKMPSVHGFRNTFPEWASDLSEVEQYKQEYIEAQLGHKMKVNNRMYYRNVTYLRHRHAMMSAWERYCRQWQDAPAAPSDNVIVLDRRKRSA